MTFLNSRKGNFKEENKVSINLHWKKIPNLGEEKSFNKSLLEKKAWTPYPPPSHPPTPPNLRPPTYPLDLLNHEVCFPTSPATLQVYIPTGSISKTITHWVYLQPDATQTPTKDTPKPNQGH